MNEQINQQERTLLMTLAQRVADLLARPIEAEKRTLWYQHNALEPTRPLIFCDPENGWHEIITRDQMCCEHALAREWEWRLRKEIFWGEQMGDDRPLEPEFTIPYTHTDTGWGLEKTIHTVMEGGAMTWDAPLKGYARDFEKLHFPEIMVDYEATKQTAALAQEILGDFLTVRIKSAWWWSFGMTWTVIDLRGLEQFMLDMYDHPQELHRLMAFLRDGNLSKLDFLERNGLLSLNNDNSYVGSGGFGWTHELPQPDFTGHVRTRDLWGFLESQETVQVSPKLFAEFVFPYQLPLAERFGLNCYGCCEPLDKRWHIIKQIPRLRRVSVSAWANARKMAESLGTQYIFSYKPSPTPLALPRLDEDLARQTLRDALRATRHCRVELIMKDNHTLGGNPQNAVRWCQIAREEVDALYP